MSERKYDYLITLTPSNNIKNTENMEVDEQYKLAEHTALETLAIVEKAIEKSETLKNVVIITDFRCLSRSEIGHPLFLKPSV